MIIKISAYREQDDIGTTSYPTVWGQGWVEGGGEGDQGGIDGTTCARRCGCANYAGLALPADDRLPSTWEAENWG